MREPFTAVEGALIRAPLTCEDPGPWPDLVDGAGHRERHEWVARQWARPWIAEAVSRASPSLARAVEDMISKAGAAKRERKTTAALARYLLRMRHRATPFGLMAGAAPVRRAPRCTATWGTEHRVRVAPAGAVVAEAVSWLEAASRATAGVELVTSAGIRRRDDRLVVPRRGGEVSLKLTGPAQVAIEAATHPVPWTKVADQVAEAFPDAGVAAVQELLAQLVPTGALVSSLTPSASERAPLAQLELLAEQLGVGTEFQGLVVDAHRVVERADAPGAGRAERDAAASRLSVLAPGAEGDPLALDTLLDFTVDLPPGVFEAAAQAGGLLARAAPRLSPAPAWTRFRDEFARAHGQEALVPVLQAADLAHSVMTARAPGSGERVFTRRDRRLVEVAQAVALDGVREVHADEVIEAGPRPADLPEHMEVLVRVDARSPAAVDSGRFRMAVLGTSRAVGTMAGRFAHLTGTNGAIARAVEAAVAPKVPAQLLFRPLPPAAPEVCRTGDMLEHVIPVGDHHHGAGRVLELRDLAVGLDGHAFYLWSHELRSRVEPVVCHALNLAHAPPLARFLAELTTAHRLRISRFEWGAAEGLAFLPRVRSGRIVLSPATWNLRSGDLPPHSARWDEWSRSVKELRARRGIPRLVEAGPANGGLRLDLEEAAHVALLRRLARKDATLRLAEAPDEESAGWAAGRAHELLVPLVRTTTEEASR